MSETRNHGPRQTDAQQGRDLRSLIRVARRRGFIVVLTMLVGAGIALAASLSQPKKYTATAVLYFQTTNFDEAVFGSVSPVLTPSSDPARQAADDLGLATLHTVAQLTAAHLRMTTAGVEAALNISQQPGSDLVSIDATTRRPAESAKIATAYAQTFVTFRRLADERKVSAAEKLVQDELAALSPAQSSGTEGASLRSRRDELKLLASLQTGNVEVVQSAAVPTTPSSPRPKRSGALGAGLGLLVGLALVLLLERLDRRVRDVDELSELLGLPVLAVVPYARTLSRKDAAPDVAPGASEVFHMLRAKLRYFNVDRQIKSVLVTSAAPTDGKSTVSWHLALAAAGSGSGRVLLLEADLRRPTLVSERAIPAGPGLAEVLAEGIPPRSAVHQIPVQSSGGTRHSYLHVVTAGFPPPNAAQLMESHAMSELLRAAARDYDLVIIDTPPTGIVSDAMPLVPQVDGVIVVARLHSTRKDGARRLIQDLHALRAPVLGLVVNGARSKDSTYGYYGYTYGKSYTANGSASALSQDDGVPDSASREPKRVGVSAARASTPDVTGSPADRLRSNAHPTPERGEARPWKNASHGNGTPMSPPPSRSPRLGRWRRSKRGNPGYPR